MNLQALGFLGAKRTFRAGICIVAIPLFSDRTAPGVARWKSVHQASTLEALKCRLSNIIIGSSNVDVADDLLEPIVTEDVPRVVFFNRYLHISTAIHIYLPTCFPDGSTCISGAETL